MKKKNILSKYVGFKKKYLGEMREDEKHIYITCSSYYRRMYNY
jgi:hypothetical protein